jgi:DNA (cytosine-5)-methyltransferase 1
LPAKSAGRWATDPLALPNIRGAAVRLPSRLAGINNDVSAARQWASRLKRPVGVDLFSGAGGLGLGLERAGVHVVAAADSDPAALQTYAANLEALTWCGDLSDPTGFLRFLADRGVTKVDVVAGGPPCQPFSRAGSSKIRSLVAQGTRPADDERVDLWRSFTTVVDALDPKAILIENVPDMASWNDGSVLLGIMQSLNDRGYVTDARVLHAERYGVPQHRQRLFVVARRSGHFTWPRPLRHRVDLEEAIGDLPPIEAGHRELRTPYAEPASDFQIRARRGIGDTDRNTVFDHVCRAVRQDDAEAFSLLKPGQTYRDLPKHLKRYRDDIFSDKYKRLAWDDVCRTITAHIARDGYWYIHPDQTRTLSIREAARIQTFPDAFRFCGHPSVQLRQIGNAVPPALGAAVARRVVASLASSHPAQRSAFGSALRAWSGEAGRHLVPGQRAAWAALISELALGRRTVAQADKDLRSILTIAPWPAQAMVREGELAAVIGARAAAKIVKLASTVVERHNGDIPVEERALRALPSVGAQTAAVVRAFGFGENTVLVGDGERRIVERVTGIPSSSMWNVRLQLLKLSGAHGPDVAFNVALRRLTEICTPSDPRCGDCPVAQECRTGRRRLPTRGRAQAA